MTGARNAAAIVAVIGASGSGKSLYLKQTLRASRPPRLMVWDPQGEYEGHGDTVDRLETVRQALVAAGDRGRFALVFAPAFEPKAIPGQFGAFCQLAYAAGHVALVCEELADVTQPSWAPAGWSLATRKGRHRGLTIYGASQRPASIDKDFFGNATLIRCGRLNFEADLRTMANVLGVTQDQIRDLRPLQWVERDMQTGQTTTGTLKIRPSASPESPKSL